MKVIVEFGEEDMHEFDLYKNASTIYSSLSDIKDVIRSMLKYEEVSEEVRLALERIRNLIDVGSLD